MPRKKVSERLTVRVFLITASLLLFAGAITFGFIAWAAPSTYTAVMNDDLAAQMDVLVEQLADTAPEDCGKLLDEFTLSSGATATLTGPDGRLVDTGAQIALQAVYESGDMIVTTAERDTAVSFGTTDSESGDHVSVTMSEQSTIAAEVRFSGREESYTLYVTPRLKAENVAVRALVQMAPWLLLVLLTFSLLCAFLFPVHHPAHCADERYCWEDGRAGLSLGMRRNAPGRDRAAGPQPGCNGRKTLHCPDRVGERQPGAPGRGGAGAGIGPAADGLFNAASHELKTPVTILKGQLTGMLEGVGVYQNRDKYLLRSLQVTGRMENLVQEMLTISRMEAGAAAMKQEPVELSALLEEQLKLDAGLLEQRSQHLDKELTPGITTIGDAVLLGKVLGNLISNASLYSPDGAGIRIWCGWQDGRPAVTVENAEAHIGKDALPHLYEAFYREECSRNRASGGSGLGLYLVKIILDRHGATCTIENTADGVRATVCFPSIFD